MTHHAALGIHDHASLGRHGLAETMQIDPQMPHASTLIRTWKSLISGALTSAIRSAQPFENRSMHGPSPRASRATSAGTDDAARTLCQQKLP